MYWCSLFLVCSVDKCAKCDSHASCDNGKCKCNPGYDGDGETCTPQSGPGGSPGGMEYNIFKRLIPFLYGRGFSEGRADIMNC